MVNKINNIEKITGLYKKESKKVQERIKKKRNDDKFERVSFIEVNNKIYEQIHNEHFVDKDGETYEEVMKNGIKYKPLVGEEIKEQIVMLPDFMEDYIDIKTLIIDIRMYINEYYDCDEQTEIFSAWYVVLTWVYDRLDTINYLRAQGDYGTGKSRFLDVVGRLAYKSILGSGAGSIAALKRMVMKWRGTVLTDEGDFKNTDETGDMMKFYNLGFEKHRSIYQCNKNDPDKIEFYKPYCPKILTTRKPFSDQALESRCLTHITTETKRDDIPVILPQKFYKEQQTLRNKLLKFRMDNYFKIDPDKVLEFKLEGIEPRLKQAMVSFAVLFANNIEMMDSFKDFLMKYQKELKNDRAQSFDGLLVNAIFNLLNGGQENITCQDICNVLEEQGQKAYPKSLGKKLKGMGILTKQKKINGIKLRVIVFDQNYKNAVKKYVIDYEKGTKSTESTIGTVEGAYDPKIVEYL